MLRTMGRSIGAAATLLAATPALAQVVCGERQIIVRELEAKFDEIPRAVGLMGDGRLIEVLVSPEGTWTMLVTFPSGGVCIVGHGSDWQSLPVIATGRAS